MDIPVARDLAQVGTLYLGRQASDRPQILNRIRITLFLAISVLRSRFGGHNFELKMILDQEWRKMDNSKSDHGNRFSDEF